MPESPRWFHVDLPTHLTWGSDPEFWRNAIVAEIRKSDPTAFSGQNFLRPFRARHTQSGVVLDLIMVLVDVQGERVVLVAFPSFIGPTVGAGTPLLSSEQLQLLRNGGRVESSDVRMVGADPEAQDTAALLETRLLAESGLRALFTRGPAGDKWKAVLHEFAAPAWDFLDADGHSLTPLGVAKVETLVRGTVSAAASWLRPDGPSSANLLVRVENVSPAAGPIEQRAPAIDTDPASAGGDLESRSPAVVEVRGSSQTGFATNPIVKAFWNGAFVGELRSLGGQLNFKINSGGELRLKSGFRSATVQIGPDGSVIYLEWDRTWGRLVASQHR